MSNIFVLNMGQFYELQSEVGVMWRERQPEIDKERQRECVEEMLYVSSRGKNKSVGSKLMLVAEGPICVKQKQKGRYYEMRQINLAGVRFPHPNFKCKCNWNTLNYFRWKNNATIFAFCYFCGRYNKHEDILLVTSRVFC